MTFRIGLYSKIGIAALLLWYLYSQESLTLQSFSVFTHYPVTVAILSGIFAFNLLLASLRWKWLLGALGIDLAYKSILDINIIGTTASVVLPGGAGGDALRAFYITRKSHAMTGRAILSLVIDRLFGLVVLLMFAAASAAMYYARFYDGRDMNFFIQSIFALVLLAGVMLASLFGLANRFHLRARLKPYGQKSKAILYLVQLLDCVVTFKGKSLVLLGCFLLSAIIQLGTLWSLALLAQTMAIGSLTSFEYMTAGSFSMLANAIPITPGGIGVGESAFNYFCQKLSGNGDGIAYATVFFSYRIIYSLLSMLGIWRFIAYRQQEKMPHSLNAKMNDIR